MGLKSREVYNIITLLNTTNPSSIQQQEDFGPKWHLINVKMGEQVRLTHTSSGFILYLVILPAITKKKGRKKNISHWSYHIVTIIMKLYPYSLLLLTDSPSYSIIS
jgi:hypothetical protein